MRTRRTRLSATAAMVGGAIWAGHALLLARRPEGCVAEGCYSGVLPRETEDLAWLFLVAVALIAVAAALLPARGGLVRVGCAFVAAGAVALAAGIVVNGVLVGDSPLWWLHDSDSLGRFLPVLGSLLVGIALARRRVLARWAGTGLVLAALVSLGFNAQTERVLLTLPLGIAWLAVGAATYLRNRDSRGAMAHAPGVRHAAQEEIARSS